MNDAEGFVLADAMITAGLLTEINATRIRERAPNGAVLISCGDRDRFRYHFEGCGSIVNIHAICLNGGGALLGDHVDLSRRRVILEDTVEAFAVKSLSFVLDLAHFPCGKCKKLGMGFRETLLRTLEGKAFLKRSIPTERLDGVLPLVSIDWRGAALPNQDGVGLYATHLKDLEAIAAFQLESQMAA